MISCKINEVIGKMAVADQTNAEAANATAEKDKAKAEEALINAKKAAGAALDKGGK